MASFQPGNHVHVAMFGKGIVREVRNSGRYLVEVKGRAMEVAAAQLEPADHARPRGPGGATASSSTAASDARGPIVTLDLHGHTVEQALEALERCLNDALLAGASEIRVIHGKSGGRIKAVVHRRLRELPSARKWRTDPRNTGVTSVCL